MKILSILLLALFIASCNQTTSKQASVETDENGVAVLSDEQIEEIVKRSYQSVAMYNVNQKQALAEELPPANAFWSFTLYDEVNGFFIPNDHKKYSVGENSGMKLNAEGGIDIYIAAEKPAGVPAENWLPVQRTDLGLNIILRIYAPDLEKMKTWKAPKAVRL